MDIDIDITQMMPNANDFIDKKRIFSDIMLCYSTIEGKTTASFKFSKRQYMPNLKIL
jgi:hypothetical protein